MRECMQCFKKRTAMGHKASLGHCGDRVRPVAGADDGAGQPAALHFVPAPQPTLRTAAANPAAVTWGMPGCPPVRPAAQQAPTWAEAPAGAADCAANALPAAQARGGAALQGARAVPPGGIISATHAASVGRSAKLGQPALVPPSSAHGRSLHILACMRPGCERADGSAAGAGRSSCVAEGLQVQQGASCGIPCGPQGAAMAPLPALQAQGWALIDLGPALAHVLQREASGASVGAPGRATRRAPALAVALKCALNSRAGWDGSPPLPQTVRSASGLRGQMLRGGAHAAAPALVQALAIAPAGAAGRAPSRNPTVGPYLYPTGAASTGPVLGALAAELAAGLAELRRLRSALIGSARGPCTAAKPQCPSLSSMQARPGRTPRDARRSNRERGCTGSERGRSPPGYAPGPPRARPHRPPSAGSAPPRRPAFGRIALQHPAPPLAAASRPQQRRATRPASVDGEPARRSGSRCAVPERRPAGSACGLPLGAVRISRMALAPAAPAPQRQRLCTAAVGGSAPGGYAPRYRMQARPGLGATTCAATPRLPACSRAPAAWRAEPAAEAMRHAADPGAQANTQAGRSDAGEGGACVAAGPTASSTRREPSRSSALSGRDTAMAGALGRHEQGSGSSAQSSAPVLQERSRGACGSGGSGSGSRSAARWSVELGSRADIAEARGLCCGSHSGDDRLVQQADCPQSTSLSQPAQLADRTAGPATALSVSSAGSVDPGLAALVFIRLGDGTRRSSDGGREANMARTAETHGAASGRPTPESLMEPGGLLHQLAHGNNGLGGIPPSLGARAGPLVPQLALARNRPAGMQAACSVQPRPPQQAVLEAAASAQGAAACAGPGLPVLCTGQSSGAGARPGLASVPHAGATPSMLSAMALGAGLYPAGHFADAGNKVANWLRASTEPDLAAEPASAAGSAHAGLPVSEGGGRERCCVQRISPHPRCATLASPNRGFLITSAACWTTSCLMKAMSLLPSWTCPQCDCL